MPRHPPCALHNLPPHTPHTPTTHQPPKNTQRDQHSSRHTSRMQQHTYKKHSQHKKCATKLHYKKCSRPLSSSQPTTHHQQHTPTKACTISTRTPPTIHQCSRIPNSPMWCLRHPTMCDPHQQTPPTASTRQRTSDTHQQGKSTFHNPPQATPQHERLRKAPNGQIILKKNSLERR